jgi:F5/8 type C domain
MEDGVVAVGSSMDVSRRLLVSSSGAVVLFMASGIVSGCGAMDCNETATCPIVGDDVLMSTDSAVANDDAVGTIEGASDATDGALGSGDGGDETGDETVGANDAGVDATDGVADGPAPMDAGPDADGGSNAQPEAAPEAGPKCGSNVLRPTAVVALSSTSHLAAEAIDSNFTTRWESTQGIDPEWIYVDLGARVFINRLQIAWLSSCAANYDLQVSNDASTWATIRSITGNAAGGGSPSDWSTAVDHQGLVGAGRYLRVFGKTRCNTSFGYSMWEMQVSGDTNPNCTP